MDLQKNLLVGENNILYKKFILISIIYSLFGSIAFFSCTNLYTMACFNEKHLYPYLYPFSIAALMCSSIVFIMSLYLNIDMFRNSTLPIWKAVGFEFLIVFITFIPFVTMWMYILGFIGTLF